jgi:AmiR/NasT family two-component response regulator
MAGHEPLNLLVVDSGDKLAQGLKRLLPVREYPSQRYAATAGEARRMLNATPADILVINTPLADETGLELAMDFSRGTTVALLLVRAAEYPAVHRRTREAGVVVLARPATGCQLGDTLALMGATSLRLRLAERKNESLRAKMEDIRTVNRAKWLLITNNHMTEDQAHHYIEDQAMDRRLPRRQVAEIIINRLKGRDY